MYFSSNVFVQERNIAVDCHKRGGLCGSSEPLLEREQYKYRTTVRQSKSDSQSTILLFNGLVFAGLKNSNEANLVFPCKFLYS
jgi:hypothetical protein